MIVGPPGLPIGVHTVELQSIHWKVNARGGVPFHDPVEAFRVNTLGAYNVIRAAVECGIRRVVQTGPQQVTNTMPGGYWF